MPENNEEYGMPTGEGVWEAQEVLYVGSVTTEVVHSKHT